MSVLGKREIGSAKSLCEFSQGRGCLYVMDLYAENTRRITCDLEYRRLLSEEGYLMRGDVYCQQSSTELPAS